MPLLAGTGFGPGTLTAIVLFVPVSAWIIHACFGTGRLSYKALAIIFFNGVFFHIILTGPLMLFINGNLGSAALVGTQLANAVLFLLIPWVGENWRGGVLIDRSHDCAIRGPCSGKVMGVAFAAGAILLACCSSATGSSRVA